MEDVAVILPVYNAGHYLDAAMQSVLSQTHADFTFCIIDDGSTDGSRSVLERYAAKDSRIRFRSRENRGLIDTLNELAEMTGASYLIRMDADDICEPQRFAELVEFMQKNDDCVACGSEVLLIDPCDRPLRKMGEKWMHEKIDAAHLAGAGGAIIHPASIIRASAFKTVGGYRKKYTHAEDIDLFLRLAELGRLANLPLTLLRYRQHFSSIGYSNRLQQRRSTLNAIQDAYTRRGIADAIVYEPEDAEPVTERMVFSKWAWWALSAGHLATARHYTARVLAGNILSRDAWKLLACVLRGSVKSTHDRALG
ncbi:glycosyltransferase [Microbulbifer sp. Q7]|uniref:glycosyltransferase family 2 protein n=1 Tax=Microbulbifer sp. Q7 TaxID=1785091 RepID=UPI00082AFDE1|nr:glycosyltransferase [Microbulbifer sp. Q7]